MRRYLLRVEGVNLAASLDDTQDLGATQGASLALLNAPEAVRQHGARQGTRLEPIYVGASQGLFRFEAESDDAAEDVAEAARGFLVGSGVVFSHLSFVVDVEPIGADEERAKERVLARNRRRQVQTLTVRLPEPNATATDPCVIDRVRPGVEADREGLVSASVKARRQYRRGHRDAFYHSTIGLAAGLRPRWADDFLGLVSAPPRPANEAIRDKLALIYFDGNRFGKIREDVKNDRQFSEALLELRRGLMAALLAPNGGLVESRFFRDNAEDPDDPETPRLPLETLVWGGDEMLWAVPAWLAVPLVGAFFKQSREWKIGGHRLTHAGGVVIGSYKTPVRQMIALAHQLADNAKGDRSRSALQIEILESLDIPDGYLDRQRRRRFDPNHTVTDQAAFSALFTLGDEEWGKLIEAVKTARKHFPRSQLYRLLFAARDQGGFLDSNGVAARAKELAQVIADNGYREITADTLLGPPPVADATDGRLLRLAAIAGLWDYVDPVTAAAGDVA
ncbi:hypothetical protein [Phaeospirillum tilakii]|uniref:Uncharacterized protein n=1 Tax=Phaeospirillum tilakii TaxID=741673 RepID=A0ABW5C9W3_9PROT